MLRVSPSAHSLSFVLVGLKGQETFNVFKHSQDRNCGISVLQGFISLFCYLFFSFFSFVLNA